MSRSSSSRRAESAPPRRIRVLLVDDSALTLAALANLLPNLFPVEIVGQAASGEEALALAGELNLDLVITDLEMPGLSGFAVCQLLRAQHPNLRSIIISVHAGAILREASLRSGADAFIPKVCLADELAQYLSDRFPPAEVIEEPSQPILGQHSHEQR
jgi:DNA-binding NarL/FixJ family response regulator